MFRSTYRDVVHINILCLDSFGALMCSVRFESIFRLLLLFGIGMGLIEDIKCIFCNVDVMFYQGMTSKIVKKKNYRRVISSTERCNFTRVLFYKS